MRRKTQPQSYAKEEQEKDTQEETLHLKPKRYSAKQQPLPSMSGGHLKTPRSQSGQWSPTPTGEV